MTGQFIILILLCQDILNKYQKIFSPTKNNLIFILLPSLMNFNLPF